MSRGKEAAYVINDQVAWGQSRDQLRLSAFSATVVSDAGDQDELTLDQAPLHISDAVPRRAAVTIWRGAFTAFTTRILLVWSQTFLLEAGVQISSTLKISPMRGTNERRETHRY